LGVHNCPYEKKAFDALRRTPEWKKAVDDNKALLDTVAKNGGFVNFTLEQIVGVRDTLFIDKTAVVSFETL
jgi:hypothetical protein